MPNINWWWTVEVGDFWQDWRTWHLIRYFGHAQLADATVLVDIINDACGSIARVRKESIESLQSDFDQLCRNCASCKADVKALTE